MATFISKRETQFSYFDRLLGHPVWKGRKILDFGGNVGGFLVDAGEHVEHDDYYCLDLNSGAVEQGREPVAVLVLSPARLGFLDRWASDLEGARRQAQRRLVVTVASLAKAGIAAEARVGDESLVQAVEDQLQSFPATEVVLVTGAAAEDPEGEAAAADLGSRLRVELRRVEVSGRAAR